MSRRTDEAADLLHRLHLAGGRASLLPSGALELTIPEGEPVDLDEFARLKRWVVAILETVDSLSARSPEGEP